MGQNLSQDFLVQKITDMKNNIMPLNLNIKFKNGINLNLFVKELYTYKTIYYIDIMFFSKLRMSDYLICSKIKD